MIISENGADVFIELITETRKSSPKKTGDLYQLFKNHFDCYDIRYRNYNGDV